MNISISINRPTILFFCGCLGQVFFGAAITLVLALQAASNESQSWLMLGGLSLVLQSHLLIRAALAAAIAWACSKYCVSWWKTCAWTMVLNGLVMGLCFALVFSPAGY